MPNRISCSILAVLLILPSVRSAAARAKTTPSREESRHKAARALVDAVLTNMSAGIDVGELATLEVNGTEISEDLVENDHPATPPFYTRSVTKIRRAWDFRLNLSKTDRETDVQPNDTIYFLGERSVTFRGPAADRKRTVGLATPCWLVSDPIGSLRLARDAPDLTLEADTTFHGVPQHVLAFRQGSYPVRIFIGASSLLPTATEAVIALDDQRVPEAIAWNAMGDITERSEFMNWSWSGGIRYPLQQDEFRNGDLYRTLAISTFRVNTSVDATEAEFKPSDQFAPASVQDFGPNSRVPGPYPNKPISEIEDGVIQIPNSWYTTIVRQDDGLVIIDAPISSGYSKGVLAEAERRYPGMPVKALITSTGFFWHVGGVREYAARGIPIYADTSNMPVINRILSSAHTLVPDRLARSGHRRVRIVPVSRPMKIGNGRNAISIFPVTMATQPMLMTYIGNSKLLHTGEMVQPLGPGGAFLFPESLIELIDTVRRYHLTPRTIIGMHMSPHSWEDVSIAAMSAGVKRPDYTVADPLQSKATSRQSR